MDVDSLFRKMHAIYGTAWLNQWPSAETVRNAKLAWSERLQKFDDRVIDAVLEGLDTTHPTRPPNLLQFAGLCQEKNETTRLPCHCGKTACGKFRQEWLCDEHHPQWRASLRSFEEMVRANDERYRKRLTGDA